MIMDFNESIQGLNLPTRKDDEDYFSEWEGVFINLNSKLAESLAGMYYLEVVHKLYRCGQIKVFVLVDRGMDIPERLLWLNECRF